MGLAGNMHDLDLFSQTDCITGYSIIINQEWQLAHF